MKISDNVEISAPSARVT